jgi:hypothetical protein
VIQRARARRTLRVAGAAWTFEAGGGLAASARNAA